MTAPSLTTDAIRNAITPIFAAMDVAMALLGTQDLHSSDRSILNNGSDARRALMRLIEHAEKRASDYRAQAAEDFEREQAEVAKRFDFGVHDEQRRAEKGTET